MRIASYLFILAVVVWSGCTSPDSGAASVSRGENIPVNYPEVYRDEAVTDNYFGRVVADPYRWLEDPNSKATKTWVKEQNDVTFGYLDQIPYRGKLEDQLTTLYDYERYSAPFQEGEQVYYFKNDGLQNQSVMYRATEDGDGEVVLDPNKFSADGTTSLAGMAFSDDGRYMAYSTSEGGSDWRTFYVKDMRSGELLDDKIEWGKFTGINWAGNGFFYSRYPAPKPGDDLTESNLFHQVYYHEVGTPQTQDELVFADREHGDRNFYGMTTEDERFLVVSGSQSTSGNSLMFRDLSKDSKEFVPIVETFESDYSVVDNVGDQLLVLTNDGAPLQRLVAIDTKKPGRDNWKDVIPESENTLRSVNLVGGRLYASYIVDAQTKIKVYSQEGKYLYDVNLPGIGSASNVAGKKDAKKAYYTFSSFTHPTTVYEYDIENNTSTVWKEPKVSFDPDEYVTKQVRYKSKDGTEIPMFITHKKDLQPNGALPTLLYGYGGFNIPILPGYSPNRMALLENGAVYAVANIRGGGEYGKAWHDGGRLDKKQNVFDDFIAAAEYLIGENYTNSDRLAIEGRSNGGLLVGATMTQRPDLFAVAFPAVGVLDMLRYHTFTIGRAWKYDYGLSEDSLQFNTLYAYSPLHNVKPGIEYPATMVTTADHDDRVVPAHSYKFISELQRKHQGDNPVLIRVETDAGHGAGKPISKTIEENADLLSFMFYNMDYTPPVAM